MKYIVLIAALITLNGCDMFNFGCGMFGSSGWFNHTVVIDRPLQDITMATGEYRTIFLDSHMHIAYVYEGAEECRTPDYKSVPEYTVRLEDGSLADVSITTDTTKTGRYGGHAKNLRIHTKATGATKLILNARWYVGHDDESGTTYYQNEDFKTDLVVGS
jgi:hypothetical protein